MALSKLGLDGKASARAAFELNTIDSNALRFLLMAKLSNANRDLDTAQEKLKEVRDLAAEHEWLLQGNKTWQAALSPLKETP